MSETASEPSTRVRWDAAFRHRDFNRFQASRTISLLGLQMQGVAIGWQVYAMTGRAIDLAWVGLAQFLPSAGLSLVGGHAADRYDRRTVLMVCHTAMAALSLLLYLRAGAGMTPVSVYVTLGGVGVTRAFLGPAMQSIVPTLVAAEHFGNAVAWGASFWQLATILGPALGGWLYALAGAPSVYGTAAGCSAAALGLVVSMRPATARAFRPAATRSSILAGVRYVRGNPIVLGAISLDLFAVLLGGATALLPVFAVDILHRGPEALGYLRSAPAVGAALTGLGLAVRPIDRRAGAKMLACVALFGVATIVFGLSRNFFLSMLALAVAGAADMISVVVRAALVQLATPDTMRGRVSAVNVVFIGASNELGEFESGLTAQWLGAVPAVVMGGAGTLLVVALWLWRFPQLSRVDRLDDVAPTTERQRVLPATEASA